MNTAVGNQSSANESPRGARNEMPPLPPGPPPPNNHNNFLLPTPTGTTAVTSRPPQFYNQPTNSGIYYF